LKKIIISGTSSGCGKTTITCAVMKAILNKGLKLSSFKCGPDYIDPMFHEKVVGTSAHNLDSFFCDENIIKYLLCENSKNSDISVIEGVMGFYDGGNASACEISEITQTSVILIVNCKGMSDSIGAVMKGFLTYRPNRIIGFIFNNLPEKLENSVKNLCRELNVEYFGFMPKNNFTIESRHLGLVPADEIDNLRLKIEEIAKLAEKYMDIQKIIDFSESTVPDFKIPEIKRFEQNPLIAVAKDKAFCFHYSDNIALLEKYGCRIEYFSPLNDNRLPENVCGLILNGGYPELHAKELSENTEMKSSIRHAVNCGLPTIAECGGFMYLHDFMESDSGKTYSMAGVINGTSYKTDRLKRFGYAHVTTEKDSMIFKKPDNIAVHEFHYWDSTNCGSDLTATKADGRSWTCCHCSDTMYAGFPHLYFYSNLSIPERFINACIKYGEANEQN